MMRTIAWVSALAASAVIGCTVSTTTTSSSPPAGDGTSSGSGAASSSGNAGGSSGGAGSSSGASGGSGGASSSGGASGGADGGTTGGTVKAGEVMLGQSVMTYGGQTHYSSWGTAFFYTYDASATTPSSCTTTNPSPECAVTTCALGGSPADAGVTTPPNAGTITVSGGEIAGGMVITPTGPNGAYQTQVVQSQMFNPGETMSVAAAGADVPAFQGSAAAPNEIAVTSPSFDQSARTTLSRAQDFHVTWTGGTVPEVQVALSTTQQNVQYVGIVCKFKAPSGSAIVPAAAMQHLLAADGSTVVGGLSVLPLSTAPITVGDWNVTLMIEGTAKAGTFTTTD